MLLSTYKTRFSTFFDRHTELKSMVASVSFIAASVGVNLVTFAYNLYLGRRLEHADFGLVVVIANILALLQIPLSAYTRTITHTTAYQWGKGQQSIRTLWQSFRKLSYVLSACMLLLWFIATPLLMHFFHITQILPFFLVAPLWFFSVVTAVDTGILLGLHKFKHLGWILLFEAVVFTLATVVLVELGFAQLIYVATPLSALLVCVATWLTVKAALKESKSAVSVKAHRFPWKFYLHSVIVKFASVSFITFDVLLAKHYLNPTLAGHYVLLTVVGKILYYASALFGQFVIPMVSKEVGAGRDPRKTFLVLFATTAIILAGSFLTIGVFGWLTVPFLLGARAEVIVPYVPLYAFGMTCFGLSTLVVSYYQSKENFAGSLLSLFATAAMVVGMLLFHDSVGQISAVMAVAGMLSLLAAFLYRASRMLVFVHIYRTLINAWVAILQKYSRDVAATLPAKVGKYQLVKPLVQVVQESLASGYVYGMYVHNGKKAIGKVWNGSWRNAQYWRLHNEIQVARELSAMHFDHQSVRIPALLSSQESPTQLVQLQEFVAVSNNNKRHTGLELSTDLTQAMEFLRHVSERMSEASKHRLDQRSGAELCLLFPLMWLRAMVTHPGKRTELLRAFFQFYKRASQLVRVPATVLAHRDLHAENMLRTRGQLYLIDFGFAAVTVPEYDLICTAILHWNDTRLRNKLLSDIAHRIDSSQQRQTVQAVGMYCAISLLCEGVVLPQTESMYFSALQYWTNRK